MPYLGLIVITAASIGLAYALDGLIANHSLAMVFLLAILVCSVRFGLVPGLVSALLNFVAYDLAFLKPRFSFTFEPIGDTLTLAVFLIVGLLTGTLAGRVRDQAKETAARAATMTVLFRASRALGASSTREMLAKILASEVAQVAHGEAHVFLRDGDTIRWAASNPEQTPAVHADLAAIAGRSWSHGDPSSADSHAALETGRFAVNPLGQIQRPVGVVLSAGKAPAPADQTISILCELGTIALERADLMEEMTRTQVVAETEKLRTALLSSISHDFRTPLSGILAAITALIDQGDKFSPATAHEMFLDIRDQAERSNRYVANLLDLIKLEAGAMKAKLEPTEMRDVVLAAMRRCRNPERSGSVSHAPQLTGTEDCLVEADPLLLEQALFNVIDNAIQYSGAAPKIEILLRSAPQVAEIVVSDSGSGIAPTELDRVFDRFYRGSPGQKGKPGTGLGLSIARGLIEAMGGTITARSPIEGRRGTAIHIRLNRLHEG
jgi:two-component system sensor histidine kinase KdpD